MLRYDLVIFDFDGTLADSGDWAIGQLRLAAPRFGFRSVTDEEIATLRGRTSREIVAYLGIPFWKVPRVAAHMRERMAAEAHSIAIFPEIPALLTALTQAGVRLAILTSNSESNVRTILGPEDAARFEHVSSGASLFGKARRLRELVRRSGMSPARTLYIGDEIRDIEAAREVGADSGAVAWGYATAEALARYEPTYLFESPADALPFILGRGPKPAKG